MSATAVQKKPQQQARYVVADIGGTTLRIGSTIEGQSRVYAIERFATESLRLHPAESGQQLQDRVLRQLKQCLGAYLASPAGAGAAGVGLSFAGPITKGGLVTAAPTIWGPGAAPVCLHKILSEALHLPVLVMNDITAAAWRYAERESKPFCLITVSSGIGNKVFWHNDVLVDDDGHGGELGHWCVDEDDEPSACDCGGAGHLGAIASGRGVVALAQRQALQQPQEFFDSVLYGMTMGKPCGITGPVLADAIREQDRFALAVLQRALRPLASAVSCLFAAIGIRRFLFIGGFATAVGTRFTELLGDELLKRGCFGLKEPEVREMLALGAPDDEHSLIGVGRRLSAYMALRGEKRPQSNTEEEACARW